MPFSRRAFLAQSTLAAACPGIAVAATNRPNTAENSHRPNRIVVSTYSFWQFKNEDLRDIELCFDLASDMGFDGVEILHQQMQNESNAYLQKLKSKAFRLGLDLCGFSTHQGFLYPDKADAPEERRAHDPLHRDGLPDGHPGHAREHRQVGNQQELRRADEEPRHRAATSRATPTKTASAGSSTA